MAWSDWSNWDSAGQVGGGLGASLQGASTFFQNASNQLLTQATSSAQRAELYRAAWQQLDVLTISAVNALNNLESGRLDSQILARVAAMRAELGRAELFLHAGQQNAAIASELSALSKNLGAIVGVAEILYKLNGDDFTVHDFGSTGLGLVGATLGAGLATVIFSSVAAPIIGGLALGLGAKYLWENHISPELGWGLEPDGTDKSPQFWKTFFDVLGLNEGISDLVGQSYDAAQRPPRRDPLMLDLNGDGHINHIGAAQSNAYFDHDLDGVRTKTGWVTGGDALLVMDVNGNGTIDNGSELFGDHFTKYRNTPPSRPSQRQH